MKIWGRASSVNVQKVLWALHELGIAFERQDAGGRYGVVNTDEFARMNPARRVPVLEEDGFVLWESNAILRYLGTHPLAQRRLVPAEPRERAIMDQWMEFTTSTLLPPFISLFWQLVRLPEAQRNSDALASARRDFGTALAILDSRLLDKPYLAGQNMSMADISAGTIMYRTRDLNLLPSSMQGITRWADTLAERHGFRKYVATSYEELRAQ